MHILVVEDERKMAQALQDGLETDGYAVRVAHTGEDAPAMVQARAIRSGNSGRDVAQAMTASEISRHAAPTRL